MTSLAAFITALDRTWHCKTKRKIMRWHLWVGYWYKTATK